MRRKKYKFHIMGRVNQISRPRTQVAARTISHNRGRPKKKERIQEKRVLRSIHHEPHWIRGFLFFEFVPDGRRCYEMTKADDLHRGSGRPHSQPEVKPKLSPCLHPTSAALVQPTMLAAIMRPSSLASVEIHLPVALVAIVWHCPSLSAAAPVISHPSHQAIVRRQSAASGAKRTLSETLCCFF